MVNIDNLDPPPDPDAEPGDDQLELDELGQPLGDVEATDDRADLASAIDDLTRSGPGRPRSEAMPRDALSWLGKVKPSTASVARELVAVSDAAGLPLLLIWGLSATGEHRLGYSLDCMTFASGGRSHDARVGDLIARYVWAHRRRLGVRYLIWQRRIRNVEIAGGGWRAYNGTNPHTDHVHVCRYPRAYLAPALPEVSRTAANASLSRGQHNDAAKSLQSALNIALARTDPALKIDGWAGKLTRAAVIAWQRQIGSPRTGTLSASDWHRLAIASGHYADART